jgi:hypothetical protein
MVHSLKAHITWTTKIKVKARYLHWRPAPIVESFPHFSQDWARKCPYDRLNDCTRTFRVRRIKNLKVTKAFRHCKHSQVQVVSQFSGGILTRCPFKLNRLFRNWVSQDEIEAPLRIHSGT